MEENKIRTYIGAGFLVVLLLVYGLAGLALIGAFDVAVKDFIKSTQKQNECLSNLDKCHERGDNVNTH